MYKKLDLYPADQQELDYIAENKPRGLVALVELRTKKSRAQVLYQLERPASKPDLEILRATREILYAITGCLYEHRPKKWQIPSPTPKEISQYELNYIRHHMPKLTVASIMHRTGRKRWEVEYQLKNVAAKQNLEIIQAARYILLAVCGIHSESQTISGDNP